MEKMAHIVPNTYCIYLIPIPPPILKLLFKKKRSADAQSSRFTNLTHNHTYSYSRGGKITTKHVTFKNAIMTPPGKMLFCAV